MSSSQSTIILRKEVEELAKFPEMNPGPVLRLSTEGKIILANSAAHKIFNQKNIIGKSWLQLCPGLNKDTWEEITTCTTNTGFEADIEGHCFLFTHVCPKNSENYFVFGSDVTQIKKIKKELEEKRELIANMARFPDMNPGPVLRLQDDGTIVLSNIAAKKLFGNQVDGKNWMLICPGIDKNKWAHITSCEDITNHEIDVHGKVYVFTHTKDFKSGYTFVFGADITEHKKTERSLQQAEKMATLGTLSAGVAHELNNPAAATKRASQILESRLSELEKIHIRLSQLQLSEADHELMYSLEKNIVDQSLSLNELDALTRSDLEAEIEDWIDEHNFNNEVDMAPQLVELNITLSKLEKLVSKHDKQNLEVILQWACIIFPIHQLLKEISEGSSRISEIVVALKNYSFLGQAKVLKVNLHEGIDNTLVILRNKIKIGIEVKRIYDDNMPEIMAYGSELNQVWTNLLDNAIDAMDGKGVINIRTKHTADKVMIEIEDNGKGIPAENIKKIFDPFYTTKTIGKGSGLGLSTSYGIIVEKHKGQMTVTSKPGKTIFKVVLSVNLNDNE